LSITRVRSTRGRDPRLRLRAHEYAVHRGGWLKGGKLFLAYRADRNQQFRRSGRRCAHVRARVSIFARARTHARTHARVRAYSRSEVRSGSQRWPSVTTGATSMARLNRRTSAGGHTCTSADRAHAITCFRPRHTWTRMCGHVRGQDKRAAAHRTAATQSADAIHLPRRDSSRARARAQYTRVRARTRTSPHRYPQLLAQTDGILRAMTIRVSRRRGDRGWRLAQGDRWRAGGRGGGGDGEGTR
jgi:hypothetical protein